jgi:anti-sigma regulatory factor (Ser/Thr protein kinase)
VITRQQIRAVMADGGRTVDSARHSVGLIVDVVLDVQTSEPAYVTVACGPHAGVVVVVPLARARLLDGSVQVPYTATEVRGAPQADGAAGRLDRQRAEEVSRYYAGLDDGAPGEPQPPAASNGHGTTNGRAIGSLHVQAGVVLPVIARLDVRIADDGPAAHSSTASNPWPPVSTSAPEPPWRRRRHWRWPSVITAVRAMRLELRPFLDVTGLPDDELQDLVMAAGEAASNAVEHAHRPTPPFFDVLAEVGEVWARIVVQDHGHWRTPVAGGHRGRGLQMIGVLADATLTTGSRGTRVVLRNLRPPAYGPCQ